MTQEKQVQLDTLAENYSVIAPFAEKYKRLSYMQLDYAIVHEIALFMIEPDFDFDALQKKIDMILRALPAIKRVFAQPFIHLKENSVILPVEAVRIVDNNTIRHVASHSELWSDIKKNEIKPNKLLTRTYEDNYGIYENLVFCQTVDDVLAFTRNSTRFLKELIYTNQTIEINLLERLNHINYFLALGKLHTGYNRNFDSYYTIAAKCLNKLQYISNTIVPRLKRPVYKNNKVRPNKLKLHKTNILSMHKEYHQVYKLAKAFAENETVVKTEAEIDVDSLQRTYFFFCEMLCIFAIGHFDFKCDENKQIDFGKLNMDFAFKLWQLKLKKEEHDGVPMIVLEVKKEACHTAVLIPFIAADDSDKLLEKAKSARQADEYILCSPFEGGNLFVDITNIESFRRLQQIVLRAMVYADKKRDECPFCSNKLTLTETSAGEREIYTCTACRTEIGTGYCDETKKTFYYTRIANLRKPVFSMEKDWLTKRKKEAQMYFRNITDLEDNMVVCPHCGKVHK